MMVNLVNAMLALDDDEMESDQFHIKYELVVLEVIYLLISLAFEVSPSGYAYWLLVTSVNTFGSIQRPTACTRLDTRPASICFK
jgi:hypothetical protein